MGLALRAHTLKDHIPPIRLRETTQLFVDKRALRKYSLFVFDSAAAGLIF